MLSIIYQKKH